MKSLLYSLLLFFLFGPINAQRLTWTQYKSPIYSDCKQLLGTPSDTLLINAGDLLIYKNNEWHFFPIQPPCNIHKMFFYNSHIYVVDKTPYQNSNIYKWNGRAWKKIKHPIASIVTSLYSTNNEVYFGSVGEIVKLSNNRFEHLIPPNNGLVSDIIKDRNYLYILIQSVGIFYKTEQGWQKVENTKKIIKFFQTSKGIFAKEKDKLYRIKDGKIALISKDKIWHNINDIVNVNDTILGVGNNGIILYLYNQKKSIDTLTQQHLRQIIHYKSNFWIVGNEGKVYRNNHLQQNKFITNQWLGFNKWTFNSTSKVVDDEYAAVAADFNGDGLPDIFTCGLFEEEHLYVVTNKVFFRDKADLFKIRTKNETLNLGACAGDIDNDGDIDLYISILNGKNILYQNIDNQYFIDYSDVAQCVGDSNDRTNACIMGDVDNDGDLDIFIVNEFSTCKLYLNNGAGIFEDVTVSSHLVTKNGGNSATFSDYDLDGDIDLFITTWSTGNILYKNLLKETGQLQFKDISKQAGIEGNLFDKTNGVVFTDLNNDGYPDIFVTNRKTSNRLYINDKNGFFIDKTQELIGLDSDESYGVVITDFDGDGLKDIYVSNVGENVFYKNVNGHFLKLTKKYGANGKGYSTGSAIADFDNDGDYDIYVSNYLGESSMLLENKAQKNNFVKLKVTGYKNNRNAIGSKIDLVDTSNHKIYYSTEIKAGEGYASMNDFNQIIPVKNPENKKIIITFPNGITKEIYPLKAGEFYNISDVEGFSKKKGIVKSFVRKQIFDIHNLLEIIKMLLSFLIIIIVMRKRFYTNQWHLFKTILVGAILFVFYLVAYHYFKYDKLLFIRNIPIISILLISLLIHYYYKQKHTKRVSLKQQQEIKTKLSQNLHDDLGATISSIGFYITMIKMKKNQIFDQDTKGLFNKAESLLGEATQTVTDLIWSIRPQSETLENLLLRIQNKFSDLFAQQQIAFEIKWQSPVKLLKVKDTIKQNTYLIIKEALNNILKYAQASKVEIVISQKQDKIEIIIIDNGVGFDYDKAINKGNGLKNMVYRAKELPGGYFVIESEKGRTSIKFGFKNIQK